MNTYSKLRRTIVKEGNVYSAKSLFSGLIKEEVGKIDIDNPEFYDIETKTLKLGNLCADNIKKGLEPDISIGGKLYTTYCALAHLSNTLEPSLVTKFHYNIDKLYIRSS